MEIALHVFLYFFVLFSKNIKTLASPYDNSYYTAGVVEFRPNLKLSAADMLSDHLREYIDIIRSNQANLTDIIVFPEATLNTLLNSAYVPSSEENISPCLKHIHPNNHYKFAEFLIQISCAARDVRKYILINVVEKENCSTVLNNTRPCANNGLNIYNTNVVFDRDGRIISRYRKVNLYVEEKNTTLLPEFGIFDTDFGVRFGHFICFDILFYTPAQELVRHYNIKDFIFPNFFYSELPFLTAAQLQQSWAWGNNVNLLAAGASHPKIGTTGSGIYAGSYGHLISTMVAGNGIRKLFVARVPKYKTSAAKIENIIQESQLQSGSSEAGIKLIKDSQLSSYVSELLVLNGDSNISRFLCYGEFCCNFDLKITVLQNSTHSDYYKYRIGIFDGRRSYEKTRFSDIKVCALYACTNDDVNSCGEIFDRSVNDQFNVLFESIEISGEFKKVDKVLIMPNTLNYQLHSLNSDAVMWTLEDNASHYNAKIRLFVPYKHLLTFGIYGQYFDKSAARKDFRDMFWILLIAISSLMVF